MRQAWVVAVTAVLASGCQDTSLPRTDPKAWSTGGWQELRWGMGPGDVELAVRVFQGELGGLRTRRLPAFEAEVPGSADTDYVTLPGKIAIAGRQCAVRLGFYRGELYVVGIESRFPGVKGEDGDPSLKASRAAERARWFEKVAVLLQEKYGAPAETVEQDAGRSLLWRAKATHIELADWGEFLLPDTGERTVDLSYEDADRAALARGVNPLDKNKL